VVAFQTSAATEAIDVSVLDENAQTEAGREAARELDAEATMVFVFVLTAEVMPAV
jgi:DNA-binding NarL/FixJ family response regulator